MINTNKGYSYNDLTIVPSEISNVSSRSECNPFIEKHFLPIFTAPMASVVSDKNIDKFYNNGIIPIVPRNIDLETRIKLMDNQQWVALSLKEFEDLFINNYQDRINDFSMHYYICVDIANGHMSSLYSKCNKAKNNAMSAGYKLTIMTGNIANPKTYKWIFNNAFYKNNDGKYERTVDYIRVGIGAGSGCITTSNVSIHYPQASLINECYNIKQVLEKDYNRKGPEIIADGGIRNYDHVIKALALGADYVMIGSLFAQCIESAGYKSTIRSSKNIPLRFPIERYKDFSVDSNGIFKAYYTPEFIKESAKVWKDLIDKTNKKFEDYQSDLQKYEERIKSLREEKIIGNIDVKFFGMASSDGQKSISGKKTKTSEGITKWLPVKYTLAGWVENMISYLRSAMSYTNCKNLKEFIGSPELMVNSISEINAVNK